MLLRFLASLLVLFCVAPVFAFKDVSETHEAYLPITHLVERGVVSGYKDDTFRPDAILSRAELVKLVIGSLGGVPTEYKKTTCFSDVPKDAWFAPYVCFALDKGYISQGKQFFPTRSVNVAETAKITSNAFGIALPAPTAKDAWYHPYLRALTEARYLPYNFSHTGQEVKRADMAEFLYRLLEVNTERPSRAFTELSEGKCVYDPGFTYPSRVDMKRVRATWLSWYNGTRNQMGLASYGYDAQLERTAMLWSTISKQRGYIDHKRPGTSAYYDFHAITRWFASQGVTFAKRGGDLFVENIGWGTYSCHDTECTDELLKSIKTTYAFFMSEKGRKYRPHYDSIVNPNYRIIGLGVVVDEKRGKYYLTVHYGTALTSPALGICGLPSGSSQ